MFRNTVPFFFSLTLLPLIMVGDKLVLNDGRIIEECTLETRGQEQFVVFPHGRIKVLPSQIREVFVDSTEAIVPQNDFERQQLEKGLVPYQGQWITEKKRETLFREIRLERQARLQKCRKHLEWRHAWRRETPHFIVLTNTSEELSAYYTNLFESFYSSFTRRWNIDESKLAKKRKPVVNIYRNKEQYMASGAPAGSSGLFDARARRLKLYHDFADPRFTLDVLFHEGTHLMIHLLHPGFVFPTWVNEGLAEYYGASVLDEDNGIQYGRVQEGRLAVLRYALAEEGYIPLEKVLMTPQSRFKSIHYAEAWGLVHFMLEHKKYRSKFMGYFNALVSGIGLEKHFLASGSGGSIFTLKPEDDVTLFKKRMGLGEMAELEREFLEYVYYGLPDVGARGYLDSARTRIRDQDLEGAIDDLETALRLGSQDPACFLYKARIHGIMAEYENAAVAYMQAMEREPLNPDFHLECGLTLRASEDSLMVKEGLRQIYLANEIEPFGAKFCRALEKALSGEDLIELQAKRDEVNQRRSSQAEEKNSRDGY